MSGARAERVVLAACALALVALALIAWSLVDPRPVPVMVAMSVAQGIGTLSLAAFLAVVVADLRRALRAADERRTSTRPPRSSPPS